MLNFDNSHHVNDNKFSYALQLLDEVIEDDVGTSATNFSFIREQLALAKTVKPSYSLELMRFACSMYFSNASAYHSLRNSYIDTPGCS